MPTATDIADARKAVAEFLTDSCDILRRTETRSPTGALVVSWVYHSTYPARLTGVAGKEPEVVASKITSTKATMVKLPHDAPLQDTDRLVIGGFEWIIQYVMPNTPQARIVHRVVVSRS